MYRREGNGLLFEITVPYFYEKIIVTVISYILASGNCPCNSLLLFFFFSNVYKSGTNDAYKNPHETERDPQGCFAAITLTWRKSQPVGQGTRNRSDLV